MKLVIQIPCLNEERTLPAAIADLPKSLPGIDTIELIVVDDGSSDRTAEVAKECGAHEVVRLGSNRGLAMAFRVGVDHALARGADIVVTTDGDNQYCGADISEIVAPILAGKAEVVVGCRPIRDHLEFGVAKKLLQRLGSCVLRWISKTTVRDAASGFRAFSREACQRMFLHTRFSYSMETLIQAGNSGFRVVSVDIRVNPQTRESRLFRSIPEYVMKSGGTMLAMFVLYRPGRFFAVLGSVFLVAAAILGLRFLGLAYISPEPGRTHLPSLILVSILGMTAVMLYALGVLGEISRSQRRLAEENVYLQRKLLYRERPSGS